MEQFWKFGSLLILRRTEIITIQNMGNTHDSTSWNLARAFPPIVVGNSVNKTSEKRKDKTFISQLEEKYGEGCPQKETEERAKKKKERERGGEEGRREEGEEEEEKKYTFALGGDKAYPQILLPKGWSLYVTSTAGEEEAEKEANEGREKTTEAMQANGIEIPVFFRKVEKDDEGKRNMMPEIARPRGVVERVIGAMKRFALLLNVPYLSQQEYRTLFILVVVVAGITNYNLDQRDGPY
uniref:Uncharacterized protein n=1 Tax=Paramoeba aestuarina TaxID=180227 RepID=A0A7S4U6J5_9EUKA|mmetsp:Transcript_36788/g.57802  ORF Transcript_36788/g.57802 Transcript_36788/m.57802 type:complete len:239 (+) Transcript_36788:467-1183(+)